MAKIDPGRGRLKAVKDDSAGDTVSADQITSSTDEILESINRQISSEAGSVLDEPDWVRNAQETSARSVPDGSPPTLKAIPGFAQASPAAAGPEPTDPEPDKPVELETRRPQPLVSPLSPKLEPEAAVEAAEQQPSGSERREGLMSPETADAVSNVFSVAARTFGARKAEREEQEGHGPADVPASGEASPEDAPADDRAARPSLTVVGPDERREPVFGRGLAAPDPAAGDPAAKPDSLAARAFEAALANDGSGDRTRGRPRTMVTPRPLDADQARPGLVERGLRAVGVARPEAYGLPDRNGDGQVRPWLIRTGIVALPVIFVALGGLMALLFYQARVGDAENDIADRVAADSPGSAEQAPESATGSAADVTAVARLAAEAVERAEAERLAAEQAAAEQRAAAEQAQAERAAAEQRAATERAKAEEAAAAERAAAEERARAEQAAAEERARAETAKAERAAAEERARAERAKAERARAERARAERAAAEERAKAEKAAAERARAEKAAADARARAEQAKAAVRVPVLQTANAAGAAGAPIPLAISAAPVDPKQSMAVRLTGLPNGTVLSAGTRNRDGSWTVEPDELAGLTLTPPKSFAGRFAMQVAMMKGKGTEVAGDSRTMAVLVARSPEALTAASQKPVQPQTFKADGTAKVARAVGVPERDRSADAAALANRLIVRGDQLMSIGDVASARLMYEHAATNGSAKAAAAAGMTYDPAVFDQLGLRSRADPEKAAAWYKKASAGGDRTAVERLSAMRRWLKANKGAGG